MKVDLRRLLEAATARPWTIDAADAPTLHGYDIMAGRAHVATWCTKEEAQLIVGAVNNLAVLLDVADAAELFMRRLVAKSMGYEVAGLIEARENLRLALDRLRSMEESTEG